MSSQRRWNFFFTFNSKKAYFCCIVWMKGFAAFVILWLWLHSKNCVPVHHNMFMTITANRMVKAVILASSCLLEIFLAFFFPISVLFTNRILFILVSKFLFLTNKWNIGRNTARKDKIFLEKRN